MFRCCYSISILDSIIPPQNHPFIPPNLIEITPIPSTAASSAVGSVVASVAGSTTTTPPPSPPPEEESDPTPSETYTNLSIKTPQIDFSDKSE